MTIEELREIFSTDIPEFKFTTMQGLSFIEDICLSAISVIQGAGNDVIYSVDLQDLIDGNITKEDAMNIRNSGFHVMDETYLATYV